jgi:hypothetical protein
MSAAVRSGPWVPRLDCRPCRLAGYALQRNRSLRSSQPGRAGGLTACHVIGITEPPGIRHVTWGMSIPSQQDACCGAVCCDASPFGGSQGAWVDCRCNLSCTSKSHRQWPLTGIRHRLGLGPHPASAAASWSSVPTTKAVYPAPAPAK